MTVLEEEQKAELIAAVGQGVGGASHGGLSDPLEPFCLSVVERLGGESKGRGELFFTRAANQNCMPFPELRCLGDLGWRGRGTSDVQPWR